MTVSEGKQLGEFELIQRIQQLAGTAPHLRMGIGDDCAIQRQNAGEELLTSTDLLIEGVHFDLRWTSLYDLGRKAAAVNLSDIAAMGGRPQSLFLGVAAPHALAGEPLQELARGFLDEAAAHGATLAGGDTCGSKGGLLLSVTVQGVAACGQAICRSGARPGDYLYVSGTLGDSALALQVLQQGGAPSASLAKRHHRPQPRITLGMQLAEARLATAMLDVSDGLIGDLGHILAASSVGAEVELARLPLSDEFRTLLTADSQRLQLALAGGEDYELLFTSAAADLEQQAGLATPVTRIGRIRAAAGLDLLQHDGRVYPSPRGGFDHFA